MALIGLDRDDHLIVRDHFLQRSEHVLHRVLGKNPAIHIGRCQLRQSIHRVPAFEAVRMTSAWAGHYDYNTFDQNAFIGPVPGIGNLLLASGFSGHGIQQSPAIGRGLAEHICYGEFRTIDLSPLSYARYLANAPLRELNII